MTLWCHWPGDSSLTYDCTKIICAVCTAGLNDYFIVPLVFMIWQFLEQAIREQNSNKVRRHSQQSHSWLLLAKQNTRATLHPAGTLEISPPDTMSDKALFLNMAYCLTSVLQNNRVQPGKRPLSSLLPTIVVPVWSKCGIYAALSSSGGQQSLSVITQVWLRHIVMVWLSTLNDSPWLIYWQRLVRALGVDSFAVPPWREKQQPLPDETPPQTQAKKSSCWL